MGESAEKDKYEYELGKRESCGNGKGKGSELLEVFKK